MLKLIQYFGRIFSISMSLSIFSIKNVVKPLILHVILFCVSITWPDFSSPQFSATTVNCMAINTNTIKIATAMNSKSPDRGNTINSPVSNRGICGSYFSLKQRWQPSEIYSNVYSLVSTQNIKCLVNN